MPNRQLLLRCRYFTETKCRLCLSHGRWQTRHTCRAYCSTAVQLSASPLNEGQLIVLKGINSGPAGPLKPLPLQAVCARELFDPEHSAVQQLSLTEVQELYDCAASSGLQQDVLLVVYTTKCGYCRALEAEVEQLAGMLAGEPSVVIAAVNAEQPGVLKFVTEELQAGTGPSLILFPAGSNTYYRYLSAARDAKSLLSFMKKLCTTTSEVAFQAWSSGTAASVSEISIIPEADAAALVQPGLKTPYFVLLSAAAAAGMLLAIHAAAGGSLSSALAGHLGVPKALKTVCSLLGLQPEQHQKQAPQLQGQHSSASRAAIPDAAMDVQAAAAILAKIATGKQNAAVTAAGRALTDVKQPVLVTHDRSSSGDPWRVSSSSSSSSSIDNLTKHQPKGPAATSTALDVVDAPEWWLQTGSNIDGFKHDTRSQAQTMPLPHAAAASRGSHADAKGSSRGSAAEPSPGSGAVFDGGEAEPATVLYSNLDMFPTIDELTQQLEAFRTRR